MRCDEWRRRSELALVEGPSLALKQVADALISVGVDATPESGAPSDAVPDKLVRILGNFS